MSAAEATDGSGAQRMQVSNSDGRDGSAVAGNGTAKTAVVADDKENVTNGSARYGNAKRRVPKKELLERIRSNLRQLETLEENLSASSVHWRSPAASNGGGNAGASTLNATSASVLNASTRHGSSGNLLELHTLLERYQKARSTYLQRRRKQFLVEQISATFDGDTVQIPSVEASHKDNHAQLVQSVMSRATQVQQQCEELYDLYQAVTSRREELEWMLQDVQQDSGGQDDDYDDLHNHDYLKRNDGDNDDEDVTMMTIGVDMSVVLRQGVDTDNDRAVAHGGGAAEDNNTGRSSDAIGSGDDDDDDDDDLERQQQRLETLQQKKRKLQQELESIRQETRKVEQRSADHRQELVHLQHQVEVYQREQRKQRAENAVANRSDDGDNSNEVVDESSALVSLADLPRKIQQLQEMQVWYDSMRLVMEELSGIKIDKVAEAPDGRLALHLLLHDKYTVEVLLEPFQTTQSAEPVVKLVSAKWTCSTTVWYQDERKADEEQTTADGTATTNSSPTSFSLTMPPLDDIVETSRSFCKPLFDVRYLLVEVQNRITTYEERVQELGLLRQEVLCKFVHPEGAAASWVEMVCSLNTGLVVVLKYYDSNVLVLEKLVGVSGWKDVDIETLKSNVQERMRKEREENDGPTPRQVVAWVQEESSRNFDQPLTPRMPMRCEDGVTAME